MSANLNSPIDDSTPTPGPSQSRSAANTPHWTSHGSEGNTSYFPPTSPRPRPSSPLNVTSRRTMSSRFPRTTSSNSISKQHRGVPHRSASVASSSFNSKGQVPDAGMFSEAEEDEDNDVGPSDEDDEGTPRRGRALSPRGSRGNSLARDEPDDERDFAEDDPVTVKDRQSLINVQHPFGLPIWKPALYKKSRTVTRNAETELHSQPSRIIDTHYLPGNIFWTVFFGWWMAAIFIVPAAILFLVPRGGRQYARLLYGLSWYIFWPFGKYVQGDEPDRAEKEGDDGSIISEVENDHRKSVVSSSAESSAGTIRGPRPPEETDGRANGPIQASASWDPVEENPGEMASLLRNADAAHLKSYGSLPANLANFDVAADAKRHWLGRAFFWLFFLTLIVPIMTFTCLMCWALVVTIPMARLQWALLKHLALRHNTIQFCSAPLEIVVSGMPRPVSDPTEANTNGDLSTSTPNASRFTIQSAPRLEAGQSAPSGSPRSTVLLCVYRAVGLQYYKYTIGGVNILFVNLMPIVFFVIFDGFILLPYAERLEHHGQEIPPLLEFFTSRALIFILSLASVIPLSYFIGMAVASISAQSSIGMGAVINATFGSIIEIILYGIALTRGKGLLVEGSIVGSLLAGVGLMPGVSMISGAMRKKEQKFNAKSAGVTSTMLIMAIIGTLTPTLFYQTYGVFELVCEGCPSGHLTDTNPGEPWRCGRCYYEHPNPVDDPFYQGTVKHLMYFCAFILVFSYLIGLWFSLRTHASQIWQNPQQLMNPLEMSVPGAGATGSQGRMSMYNRIAQQTIANIPQQTHKLLRKASILTTGSIRGHDHAEQPSRSGSGDNNPPSIFVPIGTISTTGAPPSPVQRRISYANNKDTQSPVRPVGYAPILETVQNAAKDPNLALPLPSNLTTDDFTRALAVTVSALRQRDAAQAHGHPLSTHDGHAEGGHGGHEAPSWSRMTSATVLLTCTALYAAIAEVLVDVVDVVLQGSGVDEKFLGLTLFALVPNTTEFMNAISFALNGNIALSMEIGSAYALQVCLLQIPAMVAFSAWYDPRHLGSIASTFTLIFPRWDVIAIILSIFLLTYTYIEAKSNYHRGTILVLSYLVLMSGFYFAPSQFESEAGTLHLLSGTTMAMTTGSMTSWQSFKAVMWSIFTR